MNKKITLIMLLLLSFLSLASLPNRINANPTTVYIDPQRTTGLDVGNTLTISVAVSTVTDLKAWEFELYYKSSVLNATSIHHDETCILKQHPNASAQWYFFVNVWNDTYDPEHGLGLVRAAALVYNVPDGVSGSGRLVWIEFTAKEAGDSPLDLTDVFPETPGILIDSKSQRIPHTTIDGIVHVGLRDASITNIEAPKTVPINSIVKINVTAENQGEIPETFDVTLYYDNNQIGATSIIDMPAGGIQILSFTWSTNGLPIGEYTLKATATQVPGEVDLSDNTYIFSPLYMGLRDIALTKITPSKTITNDTTVYINVTAQNNGETGTPSQTFNITLQYGTKTIGTQTIENLTVGSAITLTFTWNTIVVPAGTHLISAIATTVPGETNTENNVAATVIIETIKGDVTGDFKVDIYDLYQFARAYNTTPEDPKWNPNCDLNDDERISIGDLYYAAHNYGKEI
jgi:hypothetical protein